MLDRVRHRVRGPVRLPEGARAAGADDPALRDEDRGPVLQRDRAVPRRHTGHDADHGRLRPLGAARRSASSSQETAASAYWICSNELGVDELLSIEPSTVYDSGERRGVHARPARARPRRRVVRRPAARHRPRRYGRQLPRAHRRRRPGGGDREHPAQRGRARHQRRASSMSWPAALQLAADAMASGEPARLIERMRAHATAGAPAS